MRFRNLHRSCDASHIKIRSNNNRSISSRVACQCVYPSDAQQTGNRIGGRDSVAYPCGYGRFRRYEWLGIQGRSASVVSGLKPTRCFRMRGKKGERHPDPDDPPRRRANKRRGHGTDENDRPPSIGTDGRGCVMPRTNGRAMRMAGAFGQFIPTPSKDDGRGCVIFYAPSKECISATSLVVSPLVNSASI